MRSPSASAPVTGSDADAVGWRWSSSANASPSRTGGVLRPRIITITPSPATIPQPMASAITTRSGGTAAPWAAPSCGAA